VLAGTGPDAQTFAVPENSQDVIGKLSLRFWSVKPNGWYRTFLKDPCGTIQVADREIAVRAVRIGDQRLRDAVDRAYLQKYNTAGALKYAKDLGSPKSRATTVSLCLFPRHIEASRWIVGRIVTSCLPTIQDLSRIAARIKTPTVGLLRIACLSAKWIISAIESRKNHLTFTRFREACTILPSVLPYRSSDQQNPCWRT
jgi:hypothetical protein